MQEPNNRETTQWTQHQFSFDESESVTGGDDDDATRRLGEQTTRGDGSWAQGSQVGDVEDGRGAVLN